VRRARFGYGSIVALIRPADYIGPCRKLNQRRFERQFKASLTRAEENSSISVLRAPLGPLPSRHRAQRSYISFEEFDSPVEGIKSGSCARLPSLSVSVSPLPSEQADEVEPFAAEVANDEVTNSAPRKEMTEEVDQLSGTIIVRGFPSHLRVLTLESGKSRGALGWDLYRKFGDPSMQSGVEDLDVGKVTAGSKIASIVYQAETHLDPGEKVANGVLVTSHQSKVQRAAATARAIPIGKGYRYGGRHNARRRH